LEGGADVNFQDLRGWTPLMIAAAQGFEEMVEFLLQRNSKVDLKDKYGKKAADKSKTQSIFYMLSSAAIDQRMKTSDSQVSKVTPNTSFGIENQENYRTEPEQYSGKSSVKKVIKNITI